MKFNIIVADCPYNFSDNLNKNSKTKRGASSHYGTLSNNELCELDIDSLSDQSWCVLALWVPSSMLEDGLKLVNSWGFKLKQTFVWVKTTSADNNTLAFGLGRIFRQSHEICLICTKGKNVYKMLNNRSQRSVCLAENLKHSQKPDILQDRLEIMWPTAKKLEIFARRQKENWFCVGNESPMTPGEDIKDSIERLKLLPDTSPIPIKENYQELFELYNNIKIIEYPTNKENGDNLENV